MAMLANLAWIEKRKDSSEGLIENFSRNSSDSGCMPNAPVEALELLAEGVPVPANGTNQKSPVVDGNVNGGAFLNGCFRRKGFWDAKGKAVAPLLDFCDHERLLRIYIRYTLKACQGQIATQQEP